jgi:hydroxyacylglutathione hydrolase
METSLPSIAIKIFPCGPWATNAMILACVESKRAAIIDPAPGSAELLFTSLKENGWTADKILLTHSHLDHIADLAKVKKELSLPVYVHAEDAANVKHPGSDGLPLLFPIEEVTPDEWLDEGLKISVGNLIFEVIHTPGHTPGGVCFYNRKNQVLISGDTLFKGSIGNISFPTANAAAMWRSLERLAELPADTIVYPGHGEPTTIGEEEWLSRAQEIFG